MLIIGENKKDVESQSIYNKYSSESLVLFNWRDCVGIEPTRPGTQVSGSFEDYEGHQYPIQPRREGYYL